MKFENGFRILNNKDSDDKFFVIDDVKLEIGDVYRVGPNGYFEFIENTTKQDALVPDRSYASILFCDEG